MGKVSYQQEQLLQRIDTEIFWTLTLIEVPLNLLAAILSMLAVILVLGQSVELRLPILYEFAAMIQ